MARQLRHLFRRVTDVDRGDRQLRLQLLQARHQFGAAPLLPYFLLDPVPATLLVSVLATFAALVALGTLRWQVTDATLARAVGESVLVGGICAAVAYGVGVAFRV